MNPYRAYQRQNSPAWTRIDTLLAACDGVIERLEKATRAFEQKDDSLAVAKLGSALVLVVELSAGINLDAEDPSSANLLRLYEFVAHCIAERNVVNLKAAVGVMRTLREGFGEIRQQAAELERAGDIPAVGASSMVLTTA
jgi:flagellin-specific chaperone FliS